MGHLTDEEKAKIIEEEELRAEVRNRTENNTPKLINLDKDGMWNNLVGFIRDALILFVIILIGTGIAQYFR